MSFPRYPAYKDSGVEWLGEVPEHWSITSLKRRARMIYGDALAADARQDGEVAVYGSNGIVGYHNEANTEEPLVVVGRKGSHGKLVWSDTAGFVIDTAYAIDSRVCDEHLRWLFYALHPLQLSAVSQDTGVPGLAREAAYELRIATPPAHEQIAVATFLDRETAKIDALVADYRTLIELLQEKRQAVISHAVTKGLDPTVPMKDSGVEWLGEVPEHWEVAPLKRCADVIDCKHHTVTFSDEGFPVVSIREIRNDEIVLDEAKRTSLEEWEYLREGRVPRHGDLVFCRNASVGAVGYVDSLPEFCLGQDVCMIRPSIAGRFWHYQLTSRDTRGQIEALLVGATIRRLNVEDVRGVIVVMPPTEEQIEISTQLDLETENLGFLLSDALEAITLLQERRTALISAAVTGKIDVRGLVAIPENELVRSCG